MIRLGFLTPEYPHPKLGKTGGLGTSLKNLSQALSKQAGVSTVVIVYGQEKDEDFKDGAVEIISLKHQNYSYFGWYLHRRFINKRVNEIIKTQLIDLIEVPDWTGISAFMSFKVPLVIRLHGSDTYFCHLENRPRKWKNYWLEKLALKGADALISPTKFAAELSIKLFKLKKIPVQTIHYGIDLDRFKNPNPEDYEEFQLLYIGTIIRKKGVFDLAKMFNFLVEVLPKAKLMLIGYDSADIKTGNPSTWALMRSEFSEVAMAQANYLGSLPYENIQSCFKNAHVCVFPSYAETLGMVTIEAMAMQKAVVNTSIGWASELIDDGINGLLCYPDKHKEYAKLVQQLFLNPELCSKMGVAARKKVEQEFSIKKTVNQNISFYKSLISI